MEPTVINPGSVIEVQFNYINTPWSANNLFQWGRSLSCWNTASKSRRGAVGQVQFQSQDSTISTQLVYDMYRGFQVTHPRFISNFGASAL